MQDAGGGKLACYRADDAVMYILCTGCHRRALPKDFDQDIVHDYLPRGQLATARLAASYHELVTWRRVMR